jgi:hypothetical protein
MKAGLSSNGFLAFTKGIRQAGFADYVFFDPGDWRADCTAWECGLSIG